jgi:hypothetical protein
MGSACRECGFESFYVSGAEGPAARLSRDGGGEAGAWPCCSSRVCHGLWSFLFGVEQRPAHVGDVNQSEQAGVTSDR